MDFSELMNKVMNMNTIHYHKSFIERYLLELDRIGYTIHWACFFNRNQAIEIVEIYPDNENSKCVKLTKNGDDFMKPHEVIILSDEGIEDYIRCNTLIYQSVISLKRLERLSSIGIK